MSKLQRQKLINQNSFLIWFTGLSGSGKSTIANALSINYIKKGLKPMPLMVIILRKGINNDLTFTPEDRKENIRRIAEVANLMVDAGMVVLAAFVSPYKKDRENIAHIVGNDNFVEIFVNTSLEECERRDVKGLYKKAREGEIKDFTGVNAPYEAPENPEIEIDNRRINQLRNAVEKIYEKIEIKIENMT